MLRVTQIREPRAEMSECSYCHRKQTRLSRSRRRSGSSAGWSRFALSCPNECRAIVEPRRRECRSGELFGDVAGSAQDAHPDRAANGHGQTEADTEDAQKLAVAGCRVEFV